MAYCLWCSDTAFLKYPERWFLNTTKVWEPLFYRLQKLRWARYYKALNESFQTSCRHLIPWSRGNHTWWLRARGCCCPRVSHKTCCSQVTYRCREPWASWAALSDRARRPRTREELKCSRWRQPALPSPSWTGEEPHGCCVVWLKGAQEGSIRWTARKQAFHWKRCCCWPTRARENCYSEKQPLSSWDFNTQVPNLRRQDSSLENASFCFRKLGIQKK